MRWTHYLWITKLALYPLCSNSETEGSEPPTSERRIGYQGPPTMVACVSRHLDGTVPYHYLPTPTASGW